MAEFVQQSIEEMLPELEQMERIELFTNGETKTVLKRRKAHEYKLRRKTKQKEDYLQYIQYEMDVLRLIKKRRKKTRNHYKKLEIDVAVINRIHKLFNLACWRFQNDVKIWLSHIEFCKERKDKTTVGKLFTRMLQIHNKNPGLWVLAAQWEMDEGLSMETARGLLQRGLRFNPNSQHLWREYFKMELLNAEKLRKRRDILGISGMEEQEEEVSDAVLEGKIASVVIQKALEAIPENIEFCLSFLPTCHLFDFTKSIEEDIFKIMQAQYPDNELTWEAHALRSLQRLKIKGKSKENINSKEKGRHQCEKEAVEIFESAVEKLNTEKMWSLYVKFCLGCLVSLSSDKHSVKKVRRALSVFQRAQESDKLTASRYLEWTELLRKVGLVDDLGEVLEVAVTQYPGDVSLWQARIQALVASTSSPDHVKTVTEEALLKVKEQESYPLWQLSLEWSMLHCRDYTETLLKKGSGKCPEICHSMKIRYLEWASLNSDIHHVRDLFTSLGELAVNVEFFKKYIEIETAQPSPKMKKIREAYDVALRHYGDNDIDLWMDYIRMELGHPRGKPQKAVDIHWRALKSLSGELTEKFVTMYTLLQNDQL